MAVKFVNISRKNIMGFDILNDMRNEDYWYPISEEAYQYCMNNNGSFYIHSDSDIEEKIAEYEEGKPYLDDEELTPVLTIDDLSIEKIYDLEGVKINRINKNQILCRDAITFGWAFTLENGERKRFEYSLQDQLDFRNKLDFVKEGVFDETGVPMKAAEEQVYTFVSVPMFKKIYNRLEYNRWYNIFYNEVLADYINSIENYNDIHKMTYEVNLPASFVEILDEKLKPFKFLKEEA